MNDGKALGPYLLHSILHQGCAEVGITGPQLEHPVAGLTGSLEGGAGALGGGGDLGALYGTGNGDIVVGVVRSDDGGDVLVRRQLQVGIGCAYIGAGGVLDHYLQLLAQYAAGAVDFVYHQLHSVGGVAAFRGPVTAERHRQADLHSVAAAFSAAGKQGNAQNRTQGQRDDSSLHFKFLHFYL